jgi:hypothetical protein
MWHVLDQVDQSMGREVALLTLLGPVPGTVLHHSDAPVHVGNLSRYGHTELVLSTPDIDAPALELHNPTVLVVHPGVQDPYRAFREVPNICKVVDLCGVGLGGWDRLWSGFWLPRNMEMLSRLIVWTPQNVLDAKNSGHTASSAVTRGQPVAAALGEDEFSA